jgi:hypothetical protein
MNLLILLRFLVKNCAPLFESYYFKIVSTQIERPDCIAASVTLQSDEIEIYLSSGRGEISMSFRWLQESNNYAYDFYHVCQLFGHKVPDFVGFSGEKLPSNNLTNELNSTFLANNWGVIMERFSKEKLAETLELLKKIKAEDFRRMGIKWPDFWELKRPI